jgi:ATP-dependent DNA helicase RecG
MSLLPINLDHLLRHRSVETSRVEYKATWDDRVTGEQVLKTICAFANDFQNLNGGYVVLGVAEQDGFPVLPPRGLEPARVDALQRTIRGLCNRLDPAYQPVLSPEVVEDRHLLVLWCPGSETRPHQAPSSLEKGPAPREFYIRLGSETVKAQGELLTQLLQLTARVPFDDRRAPGVGLEELRESRVREFLADIESDLLRESSTPTVLRRMRVTARTNGHEVPKNVGLMFFSDDPEQWFPGARIEVVQLADDSSGNVIEERVFRGPIHEQLRSALRYLGTLSTRHLEKVRNQPETRGWVSYPEDALEEALVNAVYHRGYDGPPEPTKVYLYPDRLEVISYPGPVPGLELEHFATNRIPPTPARNRRIGELLKELRLAEGRGTGIPKVFRAMKQNGSPAPRFDFDPGRSYFRVTLPAHPEYFAISALRDAAHLRAVGASADALARLQRAFEEQPSALIATELIEELGSRGDLEAAKAVYDRIPPFHESEWSRPTLALAEAHLNAQGEVGREEARRLLGEAQLGLALDEKSAKPSQEQAWAYFDLARVQGRLNFPAAARRKSLERAIAVLPHEKRFRQALSELPEA